MQMKSSPSQQGAMAEAWTANLFSLGHALYHWATLPPFWLRSSTYIIWYCYIIILGGVESNTTAGEIVGLIKQELEERTRLIVTIFTYVNRVLSLTALLVVIQSYLYLRRYLCQDKHDNSYITEAFVKVDKKRSRKGNQILIQLLV